MARISDDDLATVIAMTRRRCRDRDLLKVLVEALKHPDLVNAKQTTSGILITGPHGSVVSHYTASDHRALKNTIGGLRRAGLHIRSK